MVSESHATRDEARRDEIVKRTLVGLEEDLDDLRDELATRLSAYEGRVNAQAGDLPEWLDLESSAIRDVYQIAGDAFGGAMLGPRAVAIGAARVEAFIHQWIGSGGDVRDDIDFDARADEFIEARTDIYDYLDRLESAARDTALDADAALSEWLDAILVDLDDQREADAEALKQLVGAGDVSRGTGAREEIAQLWEEQRARVAELRATWEPLERLVFEGVDITVEGVAELRGLVRRAVEGLVGGYDALAELAENDIDEVSFDTIPAPMYRKSDDADDEGPGHAIDDASRVTEPISTEGLHTSPYIRTPKRHGGRTRNAASTSAPEPAMAQGTRVENEMEEVDEPGPTEPLIETIDEAGPTDHEIDDVSSPTIPDAANEPTEKLEFDAEDSDVSGEDEADAPSEHVEPLPERVTGEAIRIVDRWEKVPAAEIILGLGLPGLFFAVLLYGTLARLTSVSHIAGFDPYDAWPWAWPWGFIGAAGWIVIVAVLRHWRPMWRGWWMVLVQWRELDETMDVQVDERGVHLDALRLRWDQLDAEVSRWESGPDGTFGWSVELKSRRTRSIRLVTPERNFTRWNASGLPVVAISEDVWQVNPAVVEKVRERIEA